MRLPASLRSGEVAVHDVLVDEATGYRAREETLAGGAEHVGLSLTLDGPALVVRRLPVGAAYPSHSRDRRLFTLAPGQVGRYRANFRFWFTRCSCDPSWYYESWVVHISNGHAEPDRFVHGEPAHHVDHRVHLYGGTKRAGSGSRGGKR